MLYMRGVALSLSVGSRCMNDIFTARCVTMVVNCVRDFPPGPRCDVGTVCFTAGTSARTVFLACAMSLVVSSSSEHCHFCGFASEGRCPRVVKLLTTLHIVIKLSVQ